ncbi:hypothetical protein BC831DRAFT_550865 [Entophlyctis helioformis]|nr:hypothetical protein BC831DRAFT_550865 [Entophlyctis helioformis]
MTPHYSLQTLAATHPHIVERIIECSPSPLPLTASDSDSPATTADADDDADDDADATAEQGRRQLFRAFMLGTRCRLMSADVWAAVHRAGPLHSAAVRTAIHSLATTAAGQGRGDVGASRHTDQLLVDSASEACLLLALRHGYMHNPTHVLRHLAGQRRSALAARVLASAAKTACPNTIAPLTVPAVVLDGMALADMVALADAGALCIRSTFVPYCLSSASISASVAVSSLPDRLDALRSVLTGIVGSPATRQKTTTAFVALAPQLVVDATLRGDVDTVRLVVDMKVDHAVDLRLGSDCIDRAIKIAKAAGHRECLAHLKRLGTPSPVPSKPSLMSRMASMSLLSLRS